MKKLDIALVIRDKALEIVKASGVWQDAGSMKFLVADHENLKIVYRTPFQKFPQPSQDDKYLMAQMGVRGNLPYGLDIFVDSKKVMNLEWDDSGQVDLVSFKRGDWKAAFTS
jgi:hypothetical protein